MSPVGAPCPNYPNCDCEDCTFPPTQISVLDKGFVRLDGALADDLSVVNSARVSFARHQDAMDDSSDKLIGFLMKNRHGTPFEHNMFRFHVKAPLFIFREWQRHRIGSFNEWSARYSKLEPDFYIPDNVRTQTGKPGAYTFESVDEDGTIWTREHIHAVYEGAWQVYEKLIDGGIAKEQARLVLPVGIYSQMYWTVNARSLMNFLSLRNSDQAMWEIREYAKVVESIFQEKMPITAQAFVDNGRVAP
jgi:thymidylate synthase (FAD)